MAEVLTFRRVNPANAPLVWVLSLFVPVETIRFSSSGIRKHLKRINLLDWNDDFDWERAEHTRNQAALDWMNVKSRIPRKRIRRIAGNKVDFTPKLCQKLGIAYEESAMLQSRLPSERKSYVGDPETRLLEQYGLLAKMPTASFLHGVAETLNCCFHFVGFFLFCLVLRSGLALLAFRGSFSMRKGERFEILWDASSPNEMNAGENYRTFDWICRHPDMTPARLFYKLPCRPPTQARTYSKGNGIRWGQGPLGLIRACSSQACLGLLCRIMVGWILDLFRLPLGAEQQFLSLWEQQSQLMYCLHRSSGFRTYLSACSSVGDENVAVLLLKKIGIRTLMYFYSANSYNFTTMKPGKTYYSCFTDFLCSTTLVWHGDFAEFARKHQSMVKVEVAGPMMPGREWDNRTDVSKLRREILGVDDPAMVFISVFDIPPQSAASRLATGATWPDAYSAEYGWHFMRDMDRLMRENPTYFIIYKPKRSLASGKFGYADELYQMLKANQKDPRWKILDDRINPWTPPFIADLCISMPFSSPSLAGHCKGRKFLFHDPDNMARFHAYTGLNDYVSHNYDELKAKVAWVLDEKSSLPPNPEFQVEEPPGGFTSNLVGALLGNDTH